MADAVDERIERWRGRVEAARRAGRAGDLLVLADEAPDEKMRLEALRDAGRCLLEARRFAFALEQCEAALAIDPLDRPSREQRAVCLAELGRHAEAGEAVRSLLRDTAPDAAASAAFGQDETAAWVARWRDADAYAVPVRDVALASVDGGPGRSGPPSSPARVLLFSGHMVDAPGREQPRFPPDKVPQAAAAIAAALDEIGAGPGDLGLTQGAAGGDLLFAESCLARGVRLRLLLPLEEPAFIQRSVEASSGGDEWRRRYLEVRSQLQDAPRVMPVELGAAADTVDVFERCNRWLLYTALACGQENVRFVCLWDGARSDGRGGTAHMIDEIRRRNGRVTWIDVNRL